MGMVITIGPTPAALADGVTTVNCVRLILVTTAPLPLNVTLEPATKYVPFTVTVVPPSSGPLVGVIELTVGSV